MLRLKIIYNAFKSSELTALGYIAGGLGLIAFIVDLDSYKWIKRASLSTSTNQIKLKIKL